ncbi:MAG: glycoside hydrolase family 9 protein [Paludibacter sp.]|nr:glycoside hydrolase family 9 protein [Paludibacter sp.]
MSKRIFSVLFFILCISIYTYGIDAWIRINQLGYLPSAQKKAVFISKTPRALTQFSIHDALTNEELANYTNILNKGDFQDFKSTYILDFSNFTLQGAFYIKAGLIYSPTIYINKNIYLGTADFLLNYMRQSRITPDSAIAKQNGIVINDDEHFEVFTPIETKYNSGTRNKKSANAITPTKPLPKTIDVQGGWKENSTNIQYGSTSANAVFQLLLSYQLNPSAFTDAYDATGKRNPNGIPDILDEAKWGLNWLLKMYPSKDSLLFQVCDEKGDNIPIENNERSVFLANGTPQGLSNIKNRSTGIASIAGKYASAFALGANSFSKLYPAFADTLSQKAFEAYQLGKENPGVCQSVPTKSNICLEEDNWSDDMELAATELYRLTYKGSFLRDAADYGRMEPITPWLCSDTAKHYQWFPFINIGHYMLANVENPRYQKEFLQNLLNGIERMNLRAAENPFNIGVPLIQGSNNLVTALATQCRLYRTITNDSSYLDLETSLIDWMFGKNPWGTSMIVGLPDYGNTPKQVYNSENKKTQIHNGGLINGPVQKSVFNAVMDSKSSKSDEYEHFQSDWAVYHDDNVDFTTNETTLDGTASLTYLLSGKQKDGVPEKAANKNLYKYGGITRTDISKKQIALVFTGNEYADGYKKINKTLKKLNIKASFFFTGDFYRKRKFARIIKSLKKDGHYLGPSSNKNLLYCSFQNRDSMFISKADFLNDLKASFKAMEKFDLKKKDSPFFLPPYEWYNDSISKWSKEVGLQLISNTPGTLTSADNTVPEMRANYFSSIEIYNKILDTESKEGLNGNIMLFHLGTDKKRPDKFYPRLYSLLIELSKLGYDFIDLYRATDMVDKNNQLQENKKQKRKN